MRTLIEVAVALMAAAVMVAAAADAAARESRAPGKEVLRLAQPVPPGRALTRIAAEALPGSRVGPKRRVKPVFPSDDPCWGATRKNRVLCQALGFPHSWDG